MHKQDGGGFMTMIKHGPVQRGQARTGTCVAMSAILAKHLRQLSMMVHRGFVESRQAYYDRQHALFLRFTSLRLHVQEHGTSSEHLLDDLDIAKSRRNQQ